MSQSHLPSKATRTSRAFKRTQREWYAKVQRSGFVDLEAHVDRHGDVSGELNGAYLGSHKTSEDDCRTRTEATLVSLDAAPGSDCAALAENLDTFGEPTRVWDTPQAEWWRLLSDEVNALPTNYPRRSFLMFWAELGGDVVNAARASGVTRWHGRESVRKFKARLRKLGRLN